MRNAVRLLPILLLAAGAPGLTAQEEPRQKGRTMTNHARGPFDVTLTPQTPPDPAEGSPLAHLSIDKRFHGDLEATSRGAMLSAGTAVPGSAGYVALERVTGTLHGRTGTFVLQHSATMTRGTPQLSITVVPDSGTGQLTGLGGRMSIDVSGGKHAYDLEFTLPGAPDARP